MIYNSKDKELYFNSVKLSKQELKMLFLLASNEILTFEELNKNGFSKENSRIIKYRLKDKAFIKIETIKGIGYRMKDKIEFL